MDDLISRQDAIDAHPDVPDTNGGNMISRQAAIETFEWCTDCKEYDHAKHCCPRFNRVIRTAMADANIGTDGQEEEPMSELTSDDFGTLAICAIRYCHGRQTYMPDLVRDIIRPHLRELSDKDLTVMIEDCDFQGRMHLCGDERIDKPGWLKWKADLIAERERRADE